MKVILPPKLFLRLMIVYRGQHEPELKLLRILCDRNKISIDVGASEGLYTVPLYFNSSSCIAFEPRADAVRELIKMTSELNPPIHIENFALSNFSGTTELKIHLLDKGRSTIEKSNMIEKDSPIKIEKINVKKLDDYSFDKKVGFIKIDVEGQEEEVLKGAENLLKKDMPNLLVEIEERHRQNSISSVINYLKSFGYSGYFLKDGSLFDIQHFIVGVHQNYRNLGLANKYINNFIFISSSNKPELNKLIN